MLTSSQQEQRLSLLAVCPLILLFVFQGMAVTALSQEGATNSAGNPNAAATSTRPILSNISPTSAAVGSAGFTLAISGSNFLPTSVVRWNGSSRPVTFVSSYQLSAQISAQDIQLLGNSTVTVFNPGTGGGVSSPTT